MALACALRSVGFADVARGRRRCRRTVPAHIRDTLVARYEYIVAEREVVPDLTDDLRLCDTCEKWCPPYVPPLPSFRLPNAHR